MRAAKTASPNKLILRAEIERLILGLRKPPENPQQLTEVICRHVSDREAYLSRFEENITPKEHADKVDDYIKALKLARKAWIALPKMARDLPIEYIADSESTIFPVEIISKISAMYFQDQSALPEWRREGLAKVDGWGFDLEALDLMFESISKYRDIVAQDLKRKDSTHIGLVANIANVCEKHKINISSKPRSVFAKIIRAVFPEMLDPGALIEAAVDLRERFSR